MKDAEIASRGTRPNTRYGILMDKSKIRSNLAISLVEEYGISFAETARQLGVSTSAVSKIIRRTENKKLT